MNRHRLKLIGLSKPAGSNTAYLTNPHPEQGMVLLFGIVIMAVLFTLSTALWGYTSGQVKSSRQAVARSQALQLAEAGIDKAIYELNRNSGFNGEVDVALSGGKFTTTVSTIDSTNKTITATGYVPDSSNPTEQVTVKVNVSIDLSNVAFNFGVQVGAGGLSMSNNSVINGNVYSNGNISGSGLITGNATVAGGGSPSLDQQCATNGGNFDFNSTSKNDAAQKFSPAASGKLSRISLYIKKTGSPSNATVRIVTDNNGTPTRTQVGGNGTISNANVTASYGWLDVTFSANPDLTAGTNYWLLVDSTGSATNYYSIAVDNDDSCHSGTSKYTSNWNTSNPSYTNINKDFNFRTYMGGVATSLSGVSVTGTARANILTGCSVGADAYYATTNTCSVTGASYAGTPDSPQQSMPISQAQIDEWKNVAASGGTHNGNYTLINGATATIGPLKIAGDLILDNNVTLYLTGPIWVDGNISVSNNAVIRIDQSIGGSGLAIIADSPSNPGTKGLVSIGNNADIVGNNFAGSYPLVISTNTGGSAITLNNNTAGAIYYAANGTVVVSNNAGGYQLTGYAISLSNNATITYQSGLADVSFSNGPGGSWAKIDGTYLIIE